MSKGGKPAPTPPRFRVAHSLGVKGKGTITAQNYDFLPDIQNINTNFASLKRDFMLRQVISPAEAQKLRIFIKEARNVVITCHVSPDGDAIGSSLALAEYLLNRGKRVHVITPNYYPDFLDWMHGADKKDPQRIAYIYNRNFAFCKNLFAAADLLVALDYNEPSRLDEMAPLFTQSRARKLLIDHHMNPQRFCDLQLSHPEMSSTCELIYRILDQLDETSRLNRYATEDLYAGMCTDTGRFSYNSNDPEIYLIVAALLRKGIDKDAIVRNLFNQNSEGRYRLMGYTLLNKLEMLPEYHASLFTLTRDELAQFKYVKGDSEGFVNMPLEIKGQRLSIFLREDTERPRIQVSIRSVGEVSAKDMAERFFHGGGHFNAAGGELLCPMDEAITLAHQAIEAFADQLR